MFELIYMSILGACYIKACKDEFEEEKKQKERERIRELKASIFCYAIDHHLSYNDILKMIETKALTFVDIEKDMKENEGK